MIKKVESFSLVCDACGKTFSDEHHTGFSIFVDESQAYELADNNGWHSLTDKDYCPGCHEIDEKDNLIVKP